MIVGASEIFVDPVIIICKDEIRGVKQIVKIVEDIVMDEKKPLILVCDKVDSETISTFIVNRENTKGKMQLAIISTNDVDDVYQNLAMITDSVVLDSEDGSSSYDIQRSQLGTCKKVILEQDKTVFIHEKDKNSKPKDIDLKIWNKIISKVATLYIGGSSRPETLEKLDRYDDTLRSCQSALEEGYCYGGAYIWLKASKEVKLLRKPMLSVFKQICKNAGYSKLKTNYLMKEVLKYQHPYNFKTELFNGDGIYDSAKVLRITIESASSIARLLLNTGYIMENK
jgi:chaperonin GroEL